MTMIEDCEAREEHLTDWERGFLDNIKQYLTKGGFLSPKQKDTLESVWERVSSKGARR